MWENIKGKYLGEGRINLFIDDLQNFSKSAKCFFFACQILSEMLKDVLQKRGGDDDQKKIVRIICS